MVDSRDAELEVHRLREIINTLQKQLSNRKRLSRRHYARAKWAEAALRDQEQRIRAEVLAALEDEHSSIEGDDIEAVNQRAGVHAAILRASAVLDGSHE